MEKLQSKMAWTLAILGIILVALVSGSAAYYAGSKKSDSAKKDLQSQIDGMKAEVASIKTDSVAVATPTPSAVATATPTADPTANWAKFEDKVKGISLKYPTTYESNNKSNQSSLLVLYAKNNINTTASGEKIYNYPSFQVYYYASVKDLAIANGTKSTDGVTNLSSYLKMATSVENGPVLSYESKTVGKYSGFKAVVPSISDGRGYFIERGSAVYYFYFDASDTAAVDEIMATLTLAD